MPVQTNRNGHDAVVVVGAGIVGVCTAWHLKRRGAKVLLIDRDEPGLPCCGDLTAATMAFYGAWGSA